MTVALSPVNEPAAGKVSLRGISMSFRTDGGAIDVLKEIALDVKEGELVCILGP
ncbi:MAG TPA: hypothetical protein VKF32_04210 [Thermoanaerobaculia bacterium]|nr:hypothetical protein [Thermoanaerobaculia bacterium]